MSLINQQIMEINLSIQTEYLKTRIDDYYLLDVVRYYNDSTIKDFSFIGFVDYEIKNDQALINKNESKDLLKYCSCTFANPNKISNKRNYAYLCMLDYHSFEITKENNNEVVKAMNFPYIHKDDDNYYDELDECVIRKTLVKSYTNCDFYDVTFDYDKLVKLFSF